MNPSVAVKMRKVKRVMKRMMKRKVKRVQKLKMRRVTLAKWKNQKNLLVSQ